jgi:hypothetical protein
LPERWNAIARWIARGNTLIVITTNPSSLPPAFFQGVFGSVPAAVAPISTRESTPRSGQSPWTADSARRSFRDSAVPAEPKVEVLSLPNHQSLTVNAEGPRWLRIPEKFETAGDKRGTVWHRAPLGSGTVYVVLDDICWTNAGFDRGGNAAALTSVLQRELHGGVLGFDEYRHGHGRVESFAVYLTALPGATSFFWVAAVLAGLYLLGHNVRFGPAEEFHIVERRTSREYVEAVAYMNQRARAAPLAVEAVLRRLRYLAAQRGRSTPELQSAFLQAQAFARSDARPAKPSAACSLVRKLLRLREQLYGA